MQNPLKYGIVINKKDLYKPIKTFDIKTNKPISNLAMFAKKYKITYKELKKVNPWLRENKLNNNSYKTYIIKITIKN